MLAGRAEPEETTVTLITLQPILVAQTVILSVPKLLAVMLTLLIETTAPATEGLELLEIVSGALTEVVMAIFCPVDRVKLVWLNDRLPELV